MSFYVPIERQSFLKWTCRPHKLLFIVVTGEFTTQILGHMLASVGGQKQCSASDDMPLPIDGSEHLSMGMRIRGVSSHSDERKYC